MVNQGGMPNETQDEFQEYGRGHGVFFIVGILRFSFFLVGEAIRHCVMRFHCAHPQPTNETLQLEGGKYTRMHKVLVGVAF